MKQKFLSIMLAMVMMLGIAVPAYADSSYDFINKTKEEIAEKEANKRTCDSKTRNIANESKIEEEKALLYEIYKNVEDEEKYIVDLINKSDKSAKTTLTNWEYNLKWLKLNYNRLKEAEKKVNFKYIDSYIEAYEFVLLDKEMPDEKYKNNNELKEVNLYNNLRGSYSPSDAISYAETYYKNYNPNYPDWSSYGGDCANFVSQCLHAGGKSMKNGSATDFSKWFSYGSSTNTNNVSSTWRGADAFKHFWKSNCSSYKKFTSFDGAYAYGWKGDAVTLLNSNGRGWHTMLIVGYDNDDLVYASHTNDRIDGSLERATSGTDFIIYNID